MVLDFLSDRLGLARFLKVHPGRRVAVSHLPLRLSGVPPCPRNGVFFSGRCCGRRSFIPGRDLWGPSEPRLESWALVRRSCQPLVGGCFHGAVTPTFPTSVTVDSWVPLAGGRPQAKAHGGRPGEWGLWGDPEVLTTPRRRGQSQGTNEAEKPRGRTFEARGS